MSLGFFAPLIGWLADVKIGRYETIKFGSLVSFIGSIFFYFALSGVHKLVLFTGNFSTLSRVLLSVSVVLVSLGNAAFPAAILPFFTDQVIGATADELSTLIYWYVWADNFGSGLAGTLASFAIVPYINVTGVVGACIIAICLAAIIVSDCLCQQWLDKTHKATNPIKLIIQAPTTPVTLM